MFNGAVLAMLTLVAGIYAVKTVTDSNTNRLALSDRLEDQYNELKQAYHSMSTWRQAAVYAQFDVNNIIDPIEIKKQLFHPTYLMIKPENWHGNFENVEFIQQGSIPSLS